MKSWCFPLGRWQRVGECNAGENLPWSTSALTTGRCGGHTWTEGAGGSDNLQDYDAGETLPTRDEATDLSVHSATSEIQTAARGGGNKKHDSLLRFSMVTVKIRTKIWRTPCFSPRSEMRVVIGQRLEVTHGSVTRTLVVSIG